MSKNYACQQRPQQTRHLNALNLSQFLSRLTLKTSYTPTFKPTASAQSRRRPLLLWSFWCRVLFDKGVAQFKSIKVVAQSRLFQFYEWGLGRGEKRGRTVQSKKVEEERLTATSGSIMEVHWRNRFMFVQWRKYVIWQAKVKTNRQCNSY